METRQDVHTPPNRDDRSLGTLFSKLTQETTTLVQQEIALARAEISEKMSQISSALATLIIGGFILFAGLLKLLDAAIFGIAGLFETGDRGLWIAALIVGGIVAIIGAIMLQKGRSDLQPRHLAPQRTAESLQHDKEFIKERVQ